MSMDSVLFFKMFLNIIDIIHVTTTSKHLGTCTSGRGGSLLYIDMSDSLSFYKQENLEGNMGMFFFYIAIDLY